MGVQVDAAGGTLSGCTFTDTESVSVWLHESGATLALKNNCTLRNGKSDAVYIDEGAKGTLDDCTIEDNKGVGIRVKNAGPVRLSRCKISNNTGVAVYAEGECRIDADGCRRDEWRGNADKDGQPWDIDKDTKFDAPR
jgi:parallel beta-helix repeat protein